MREATRELGFNRRQAVPSMSSQQRRSHGWRWNHGNRLVGEHVDVSAKHARITTKVIALGHALATSADLSHLSAVQKQPLRGVVYAIEASIFTRAGIVPNLWL